MDNVESKRIEQLENIIKQMLQPLRNIPLDLVISAISGHKIIPFNKSDKKDLEILDTLKKVAKDAGKNFNSDEIVRPRPNEIGNDIEKYIKSALLKYNYQAHTPNNKSTGYPDIEFIDHFGKTNYLECKTFNIKSLSTTFRSFYLSPSQNFKVTKDAHHFIISYEIIVRGTRAQNYIYKCKSWKILSIDKLNVDVKYEFNSDNARLYSEELILAEGSLS